MGQTVRFQDILHRLAIVDESLGRGACRGSACPGPGPWIPRPRRWPRWGRSDH
jgi:hypothetical protein